MRSYAKALSLSDEHGRVNTVPQDSKVTIPVLQSLPKSSISHRSILNLQRLIGNKKLTSFLNIDTDINKIALQRNCIEGHEGPPNAEWEKNKSNAHYYQQTFQTCKKGERNCSLPAVFSSILRHPAPGSSGNTPVTTGSTTTVPMLGTVVHTVDDEKHIVKNTTTDSHMLHSGEVKIAVKEDSNGISTVYTGYGTGSYASLNTWFSKPLWNFQHNKIKKDLENQKSTE